MLRRLFADAAGYASGTLLFGEPEGGMTLIAPAPTDP
jgi:hypothetical protein